MTTTPQLWQSHATMTAHAAATRPEQSIAYERHSGVRRALALLVADQRHPGTVGRAAAGLADSVERQARLSGLGSVRIPMCRACGTAACRVGTAGVLS